MAIPFIGEIQIFAGNFAPKNWAICDGTELSISQNPALYSLIGTAFGGDGRNTFALPDLRGRVAMGLGDGPGLTARPMGMKTGTESVALSSNELPSHSHGVTSDFAVQMSATTKRGGTSTPTASSWLAAGFDNETGEDIASYAPSTAGPTVTLAGPHVSANPQVDDAGESLPHTNMMPFLALNYIIALQGIFPTRP